MKTNGAEEAGVGAVLAGDVNEADERGVLRVLQLRFGAQFPGIRQEIISWLRKLLLIAGSGSLRL